LASIFRKIFPYIKSGARAFGEEVLTSGVGVLKDNLNGRPLKESLKARVTEAGHNLTNRAANKIETMVGSGGLKRRRRRRRTQSRAGVATKRMRASVKKNKKKTTRRKKAPSKARKLKRRVRSKKQKPRKRRSKKAAKDIFC